MALHGAGEDLRLLNVSRTTADTQVAGLHKGARTKGVAASQEHSQRVSIVHLKNDRKAGGTTQTLTMESTPYNHPRRETGAETQENLSFVGDEVAQNDAIVQHSDYHKMRKEKLRRTLQKGHAAREVLVGGAAQPTTSKPHAQSQAVPAPAHGHAGSATLRHIFLVNARNRALAERAEKEEKVEREGKGEREGVALPTTHDLPHEGEEGKVEKAAHQCVS